MALVAIVAGAADRSKAPRPPRHAAKSAMTTMSAPAPVITPQAIGETAADYEGITDWVSCGQVKYSDCITAQAWGAGYYATYDVDLEESASNPGLYRVKNPVLNNPNLYDGDADTSQDYYMIVDATDPTAVVIPECNYGLIDYNSGEMVYMKSGAPGTVTDQVVTFGDWTVHFKIGEAGSWTVASGAGFTFKLNLPGAKDYTMPLTVYDLCNATNTAEFTVTPGTDIVTMKYAFGPEATLDQARLNGQEIIGGENSLDITEEGVSVLAIVGYDIDGNEQATATSRFYRYDEHADQWKTLGTSSMTEDFLEAFYDGYNLNYGPNTYDVTVQENINTPDFYRILNPYENNNNDVITSDQYHATDHNHYIFIHAENPDAVTFDESPIGCNFYAMGDITVNSYESTTGTLSNGTITMPAGTLYLTMGEYATLNANDFVLVIPKEHTITVKSADEKYGTVAITDPETAGNTLTTTVPSVTVTATPADGAAFMNWTDAAGNVLSTEPTYTYVGSDDIEITAHFGLTVTFTNPVNGFITVYNGSEIVSSGSVFAPGTVLSITVTPKDDYELAAFYINEVETALDSEGKYELSLEQSSELLAIFQEIAYTLNIVTEGNGEIQVWTEIDETEELPAGKRLYDGDKYVGELFAWFIPGKDDTLESATLTANGGEPEELEFKNEIHGWIVTNGEWGTAGNVYYYPVHVLKAPLVLSAKFSGEKQGLEEIGIDPADGPVEYYNLQGIRVAEDNLVPGFYILRQGSKAVKVLIRK